MSPISALNPYKSLYKTSDVFKSIDLNSFQVSQNTYDSLDEMLNSLIFSDGFNEIMKVRAVFSWFSFVDVDKIEFDRCEDTELCRALNTLKFGNSFAKAFQCLVSRLGINAVCIQGWAKEEGYMTSSDLTMKPPNHSWNAINIEDNWFLIDSYWSKIFTKTEEIDDFFFLIEPRIMIYSHYPESSEWQLLPKPLSFESFIALPAIKPDFFKLNLAVKEHITLPLVTKNGKANLTVVHKGNTVFTYKIIEIGNIKPSTAELKHFIFQELTDTEVIYHFRAPKSGTYILKVYASSSDYDLKNDFVVCAPVIDLVLISRDAHISFQPFPQTTDASWGISKRCRPLLYPSIDSAHLSCEGKEFCFSMAKNSGIVVFVKVVPTLHSELPLLKRVEEGSKVCISIMTDENMQYGVEMYKRCSASLDKFDFLGQFLICSFDNSKERETMVERALKSDVTNSTVDEGAQFFKHIQSDLNKVREIFLFLTSSKDGVQKNQLHTSLSRFPVEIENGKLSYAHSFEHLCRVSGCCCITVIGLTKGSGYRNGVNSKNVGLHFWNVVLIDGLWHLVDCQWGRRKLIRNACQEVLSYEVDGFYFSPEPEKFIHSHFPYDLKWQLLKSPISFETFQNMVYFKPAYFKHNFSLIHPTNGQLEIDNEVDFVLKQKFSDVEATFSFSLIQQGNVADPLTHLDKYGMYYFEEDLVIFKIRFPIKGMYILILLVKQLERKDIDVFEEICEFTIKYDGDDYLFNPFPSSSCYWGPSHFASKNNLKCSCKTPVIKTRDNRTSLTIFASSNMTFDTELCRGSNDHVINNFALVRRVEGNIEVTIQSPGVGEYCLRVYAKDLEVADCVFHLAFQFLIIFQNGHSVYINPFLKLPFGFLGPQRSNVFTDVILLSHVDPFIDVEENVVCLSFLNKLKLNLDCQILKADFTDRNFNVSDYVLKQRKNYVTNFLVTLPDRGQYIFQLYGSKKTENMANIYNILIRCRNITINHFEFPVQLRMWEGFLHQPLQRRLFKLKKERILFELEIPTASDVILVAENRSLSFIKEGLNMWRLCLNLSSLTEGCKVDVCAQLNDNNDIFQTLLEYTVV